MRQQEPLEAFLHIRDQILRCFLADMQPYQVARHAQRAPSYPRSTFTALTPMSSTM